ncbi:hypothetical protein D3C78_1130890 [compost metagenome]
MIGADGAGTDETHLTAFKQCLVDSGHRAHQKDVGVLHAGGVNGAPWIAADFAKACKEGIEQRNILVGNYQHGALLSGVRSVGPCRGANPAADKSAG